MHVAEIWRYPIKSLAGEKLQSSAIRGDGIPMDRSILVVSTSGRVLTSRTRPRLLGLKGTIGADGIPYINGFLWNSPEALELVTNATGEEVRLYETDQISRFDVLPLSVATDGAIDHLAIDGRRLRPNIVVGGVKGLAERSWPRQTIRIADVELHASRLRPRCVMTTFDPDTQEQDPSVLRRIVQKFGGTMSLDCSVLRSGTIAVGDEVEIV